MREHRRRATDHRAIVLESIATNPTGAQKKHIVADCRSADFTPHMIDSMIWQLRKEGLIGRDDATGHFITKAGLAYLNNAAFDLPPPPMGHPRPGARKPRGKKQHG